MVICWQNVAELPFGCSTDFFQIWRMVIQWQTVAELPFCRLHKLKRKRNLRYFKFAFTLHYSVECLCPNAHISGCDKFSFFVGRSSFKDLFKPIFVCEVQVKTFVMEEEGHTVEGDQSLSDKLNQLQQIGMLCPNVLFHKWSDIFCSPSSTWLSLIWMVYLPNPISKKMKISDLS